MIGLPWSILAQSWVEQALNSLPAGLLIAVFAWALLRLAGGRNSGTRFAVWFATLLAIACLPFLGGGTGTSLATAESAPAKFTLPAGYAMAFFFTWLAVASFAILRVAVGFWHLRQLRKNCQPITSEHFDTALYRRLEDFSVQHRVVICMSGSVRVPTLIGFWKPVILLPAWAAKELSPAELSVILLHECAHLQRWDAWTNLAQKMVRALFFFHPAVWWIERRLSLEREMACDDRVLAETGNPRAYAECLVSVAEKSFARRGVALAQAVVSRMRETSLRLTQILDAKRPAATALWKPALGIMGGFIVACVTLTPHAPRLIAFGQAAPEEVHAVSAMANVPSIPASVITARFDLDKPRPRTAPAGGARRPLRQAEHTSGAVVPVRAESVAQPASRLVRVSEREVSAPQLLFVVQTVQYDGRGTAVWSLQVWHLTVFAPEQKLVQPVTPARRT